MFSRKLCKNIWSAPIFKTTNFPLFVVSNAKNAVRRPYSSRSTVDQADVVYFSNKYRTWWDVNGPIKLLHTLNEVRIPLITDRMIQGTAVENLDMPLKGKTILDVGCGGGILTEGLARLGASVTGIDASEELINIALEHRNIDPKIANNKPFYYLTTIEDHAEIFSNSYDGIVASEVIEHVYNQELFVKSCVKALKPGGKIIFTTPSRTRWAQFLLIFFCEDIIRLIPKGTHQYEKFMTPKELRDILEKYGCVIEFTSGLSVNPIAETWKTTSSQRMGFVLQATKIK